MKNRYSGELGVLVSKANKGTIDDIDFIMNNLTSQSSLVMTRNIDFALSLAEGEIAYDRIMHYLYQGTQIQRNYASLYFNRLGELEVVRDAFDKGLIDEIQAFSR